MEPSAVRQIQPSDAHALPPRRQRLSVRAAVVVIVGISGLLWFGLFRLLHVLF